MCLFSGTRHSNLKAIVGNDLLSLVEGIGVVQEVGVGPLCECRNVDVELELRDVSVRKRERPGRELVLEPLGVRRSLPLDQLHVGLLEPIHDSLDRRSREGVRAEDCAAAAEEDDVCSRVLEPDISYELYAHEARAVDHHCLGGCNGLTGCSELQGDRAEGSLGTP